MQTNRQEQHKQEPQPIYSPVQSPDLVAAVLNPPDSETSAADSAAVQAAQIEAYLDAVCLQMPAEVLGEALENMRLEMRGHLEASIAAHRELGQLEAEAIQSALTQFGPPRAVAQQWQQEWTETLSETKGVSVWPSLKTSLKTWGAINVTALAMMAVLFTLLIYRPQALHDNIIHDLFIPIIFAGLPLLAGTVIGLRACRRPLFCTVAGNLLLLPVLAIGITGVNHWSYYYGSWLTGKPNLFQFSLGIGSGIQGALSILPPWIIFSLLGCSVVVVGRHIRKRIRRRQIAR